MDIGWGGSAFQFRAAAEAPHADIGDRIRDNYAFKRCAAVEAVVTYLCERRREVDMPERAAFIKSVVAELGHAATLNGLGDIHVSWLALESGYSGFVVYNSVFVGDLVRTVRIERRDRAEQKSGCDDA